jgi:hypothetical protein
VGRTKGRSKGKGGKMTQTLYAHMNKRKKKRSSSLRKEIMKGLGTDSLWSYDYQL